MKRILRNLTVGIVALGLVLGGAYGARHVYRSLRQARLLKQAKAYLAKADPRKAFLSVQGVLRANPKNIDACRLMADLLEQGQSPAALLWRSKVVEYNPKSTDDRLALAQTALAMRDYGTATNALEGVSAAGKSTAPYHNLAGTVAVAGRQLDQAQSHFREAARLDPQNPFPLLNLSVLGVQSTNEPALSEARMTLKALSSNRTNGVLRCKALRELVMDAARYQQSETALALSSRLLQETNSSFSDRLLRLDLLRMTTNAEFSSTLETYQREAATNSAKVYELAAWQVPRIGPEKTLGWLHSLAISVQTNLPVALLEAECQDATGDWRGLQASLQKQQWGELEFMRHAFACRALRKQDLTDSSKAEWEQALKIANNQQARLGMLLRLAAQWNMNIEGEDILWTIVNRYPTEQWAFKALSQVLYVSGRTRPLMTLFSQQARKNPADLSTKNNLATTALLLNAQEFKPYDLAREVYDKASTNASFASTYAFSLYLQKKNPEALQIIEKLDPKDLEKPSIAGYYGLILKASGSSAKASTYFDYAFKTPLLPEERKLFEKAKAGV
jgi:tetratricopeptide (TPR) repeat protein